MQKFKKNARINEENYDMAQRSLKEQLEALRNQMENRIPELEHENQ
jgi:hypothetical protein